MRLSARSLRSPATVLALAAAWGLIGTAGAQTGDDAWIDARPEAAAFAIVDGDGIEAPLGGAEGDAARGRALFADPETGGCIACHAAPDLPRRAVAPRILRDRAGAPAAPDPVEPEPQPSVEDAATDGAEADASERETAAETEAETPPASDSDSAEAPRDAPRPAPRPAVEEAPQLADATPEAPEAPAEADGEDAEADAPEAPVAPLPPPPAGPDLAGVADRIDLAGLRLWIVDPRAFAVAPDVKPGYHAVDPDLARLQPELRQPWFTPQQVEDVAAYLATLAAE